MTRAKWKKYLHIVSINILITFVIFAAIEIFARAFLPDNTKVIFSDENLRIRSRPFIEYHPVKGFALRPRFSNALYKINSNGFRGEEFPQDLQDRFIILTLGESTTFGWGVKNGEDYPSYLMELLQKENKNTYVINGGIPSYSSSQVFLHLKDVLRQIKPKIVLINILWNDILYSTVANWYPGLLIYQKPEGWRGFLLRYSTIFRFMVLKNRKKDSAVDVFNEKPLLHYRDNVEEMIRVCKSYRVPLAFIQPPFDGDLVPEEGLDGFQIHYSKPFFMDVAKKYLSALMTKVSEYNVSLIDHRLSINTLHHRALFLDPLHPTPEGYLLIAQDIYWNLSHYYSYIE